MNIYSIFAAVGIGAVVKLLAGLEWPPLYRLFLSLPALCLSAFTGNDYTEAAGIYSFPAILLDYSCAGINFFVIVLLIATTLRSVWVAALSALAVTLIANTFRILLAVTLEGMTGRFAWAHEALGTLVFVSFLTAYYLYASGGRHAKAHA